MTISLDSNDRQDYYCIDIEGKLTGPNIPKVKKAVECGLKMNHKVLLFNLKKMTVIDSRGIGFLTNLHKELKKLGGKIFLASLQPNIVNIMHSCGLHKVIEIYNNIDEAELDLGCGITTEKKGFYALIKLPKEFDLSVVKPLRKEIDKIIEAGYNHIVVDFKENKLITSVGIGTLLNLYKKLKEKEGDLYLIGISPEVHATLDTTNILRVISEYKTLKEIEEKLI